MKKFPFLIVIISNVFIGCNNQYHLDCEKFKNGIVNNNEQIVGYEIDQLCADLHPNITASDPQGQTENINKLNNSISTDCGITSTAYYIFTNPPQYEIRVEFMTDTILIVKFLHIIITNSHELKFAGMH